MNRPAHTFPEAIPTEDGRCLTARAAAADAVEPETTPVSSKAGVPIAAYTPAPWTFDGEPDNIIVWSDADNRVCFLTSSGPTEANARLIAAAPELLEALQDAHDKLHECTAVLSANDAADVAETMTQARIAIAKARGDA